MELVYGVMVTQLFLVQSFKVRVLVDQRKAFQFFERLFYFAKEIECKKAKFYFIDFEKTNFNSELKTELKL